MIRVQKDFANLPNKLTASTRLKLILDSLVTRNAHAFDSKVYRDTTLEALEAMYHSKCAYCETDTSAGAPMQVEHYRPKAKVMGDANHLGYYWIAYEWSNLILSCSKCNNKKRNHFPVLGTRVSIPQLDANGFPTADFQLANSEAFLREDALLLHPEIDTVENHFVFNISAEIVGLSPKATKTIEVCGLNRKELVFKRLALSNVFIDDIQEILTDVLSNKITTDQCRDSIKRVFRKLVLLQDPGREYSRFGYFLFNKFDLFIAGSLAVKQKEAALKLFDLFLKNEL